MIDYSGTLHVDPKKLSCWSPFKVYPWIEGGDEPLYHEEVQSAIKQGLLESRYQGDMEVPIWNRQKHIERVAYLVVHPDPEPIQFDVGVFGPLPDWPLQDGHHRLAAALYRGDKTIGIELSGACRLIEELLHELGLDE